MAGNVLGNLSAGLQPLGARYRGRGEQIPQTCLWDRAKKQQAKPKGEGILGEVARAVGQDMGKCLEGSENCVGVLGAGFKRCFA